MTADGSVKDGLVAPSRAGPLQEAGKNPQIRCCTLKPRYGAIHHQGWPTSPDSRGLITEPQAHLLDNYV